MKHKKLLLLISILLVITLLPLSAFADAGNFAGGSDWDFDFGGSSWDSGSDWSSSDWDDDSDWDNDYTDTIFIGSLFGGGSGGGGGFVWIIIAIVVVVFLINLRKQNKKGSAARSRRVPNNASIQQLLQNDPNFSIQKFSEDASNLYVRLQNAWQAKDLAPVRKDMTDNLYAQFERQLQPYIQNNQTNHVDNIAVLRSELMNYTQDQENDIITLDLHTRIIDYVTDDTTGQLIRGSMSRELFMGYEYTFIRTKGVKTGQTVNTDSTCPSCGAPLDINHSGRCPYCDSVLSRSEYTWALTSVKGLYQRSK